MTIKLGDKVRERDIYDTEAESRGMIVQAMELHDPSSLTPIYRAYVIWIAPHKANRWKDLG